MTADHMSRPVRPLDRDGDGGDGGSLTDLPLGAWKRPYLNEAAGVEAHRLAAAETLVNLDQHLEAAKFMAWRLVRRAERCGDRERAELVRRFAVSVEALHGDGTRLAYHCMSEWNVVHD